MVNPKGMTWDGTSFSAVDLSNKKVYQYTSAGVYTGTSFDVSAQDSGPVGIAWDGTSFWVAGYANDKVYQYSVTPKIGVPTASTDDSVPVYTRIK